jgi:hypothetical protein
MSTSKTDSHRALLYVLFCLFETLLIASVVLIAFFLDSHRDSLVNEAAGITFWFSFVGLFTTCFFLRRVARRLAVIGWLTLFIGFWGLALVPAR